MTAARLCHCEDAAWNAGDEAISKSLVGIASLTLFMRHARNDSRLSLSLRGCGMECRRRSNLRDDPQSVIASSEAVIAQAKLRSCSARNRKLTLH